LGQEPSRHGFIGGVFGDGSEGIGEREMEVRKEGAVCCQGVAEGAAVVGWQSVREVLTRFVDEARQPNAPGELIVRAAELHSCRWKTSFFLRFKRDIRGVSTEIGDARRP
jgi:hypothetical protein